MNGSLVRAELRRLAALWEQADRQTFFAGPWLHDPMVCGIEAAGEFPPCPGCQPQGAALDARRECLEHYGAASRALADLFFLLLRHATADDHEALRAYFTELLRPELEALAQAILERDGRQ